MISNGFACNAPVPNQTLGERHVQDNPDLSAIPLGICYARRASLNFNELHDNGFGLVDTALIDYD
jgi:hypothetical protein